MDCAYVTALIILEMLQLCPEAGQEQQIAYISYAIFEAIEEAERRLGGVHNVHRISSN
jgi:hypothetical protein